MASTLLEQTREAHEECERLERFIVSDLKTEAITHKQRLRQNHRVKRALDAIAANAKRLRATYADEDKTRAEELASFGKLDADEAETVRDPSEKKKTASEFKNGSAYAAFYERLEETNAYHDRRPGMYAPPSHTFIESRFKEDVVVPFSGEESNGRYLDLHAAYQKYENARFRSESNASYLGFLSALGTAQIAAVPREKKFTDAYSEYLRDVTNYLSDFKRRADPLALAEERDLAAAKEFEKKWMSGSCLGWEDRGVSPNGAVRLGSAGSAGSSRAESIERSVSSVLDELRVFESVDAMRTFFSKSKDADETVKARLACLGLKQGGTELQRLERLFAVNHASSETWPKGVDAKHLAKGVLLATSNPKKAEARAKEIAFLEHRLLVLLESLKGTLDATKAQVEKKQTLSAAELEADNEEDSDFIESEDEDDAGNDPINNPLKLPLGYDGKPIPYWLYKLHGLNLEFTCEICGNYSYWGRRAYERHFKEPRHQHGMRCLKIPNTKAFAEVTTIAEALALQKSLEIKDSGKWDKATDEEYEDADGNVYNKKTYEDLKRQGLI